MTTHTLRFAAHDVARMRYDFATLFFSIALPVFFYFIFGAAQDYGNEMMAGGNVAGYVMIGMALFAGVTGAVGAAGSTVVEHRTGWGRQLALTPLTNGQIQFAALLNILIRAVLPIAAVFIAGALSGVQIQGIDWLTSLLLTLLCSVPFGFYGLLWAQLIPSENSVAIASSSVVVLAFLGNVFVPLSGTMLDVGRFSPLYGMQMISRWPIAEGAYPLGMDFGTDPLWPAIANIAVWTTLIVGSSMLLRGRQKARA